MLAHLADVSIRSLLLALQLAIQLHRSRAGSFPRLHSRTRRWRNRNGYCWHKLGQVDRRPTPKLP
jgi:hypothetical protein